MNNLLYIFIPSLMGYITSYFCNVGESSGKNIPFRPPGWVFGVVWPILYLLFGLSWYFSILYKGDNNLQVNMLYLLLSSLLCIWIIIYGCYNNKKFGIYILLLSLLNILIIYTIVNIKSKLLLTPLMIWLLFATLLNIFEVYK